MGYILQTFLSAIIFVLIIHFLIKHYLLHVVSNRNSNYLKKKVRFQENTNRIHYIPRYQDTYNKQENNKHIDVSSGMQDQDSSLVSNFDKNKETSNNNTFSGKKINIKNEILKFINTNNTSIKENKSDEDLELNKFFQMNNDEEYELSDLKVNNNYQNHNKNCTTLSENPEITEVKINPYENSNYGKSYSSLY